MSTGGDGMPISPGEGGLLRHPRWSGGKRKDGEPFPAPKAAPSDQDSLDYCANSGALVVPVRHPDHLDQQISAL